MELRLVWREPIALKKCKVAALVAGARNLGALHVRRSVAARGRGWRAALEALVPAVRWLHTSAGLLSDQYRRFTFSFVREK